LQKQIYVIVTLSYFMSTFNNVFLYFENAFNFFVFPRVTFTLEFTS